MVKKLIMTDDGAVKPGFMAAIIAAVVLVGGYFVVQAWRGNAPLSVSMKCWVPECGYERSESVKPGEPIPGKCPKCGKDSVAPAYTCPKCGETGVWNWYKGSSEPDKCSKCGTEMRYGRRE